MKNLGNLMKQAQEMQAKMAEMQERLAEMTIEGSAGAGMVTVTLSGKSELKGVKIDPSLLNGDEAGSALCQGGEGIWWLIGADGEINRTPPVQG